MSVIQCPECGSSIESVAQTCPECGFPLWEAQEPAPDAHPANGEVDGASLATDPEPGERPSCTFSSIFRDFFRGLAPVSLYIVGFGFFVGGLGCLFDKGGQWCFGLFAIALGCAVAGANLARKVGLWQVSPLLAVPGGLLLGPFLVLVPIFRLWIALVTRWTPGTHTGVVIKASLVGAGVGAAGGVSAAVILTFVAYARLHHHRPFGRTGFPPHTVATQEDDESLTVFATIVFLALPAVAAAGGAAWGAAPAIRDPEGVGSWATAALKGLRVGQGRCESFRLSGDRVSDWLAKRLRRNK